jgi:hypothetical protein
MYLGIFNGKRNNKWTGTPSKSKTYPLKAINN